MSISTVELASMIKMANIDFVSLPDEDFDHPLGESTGAAVIFGATGGVMEAAVRTAYEVFTGKTLERLDFKELRGFEGIRTASVDFNGTTVNVCIAHQLGNARKVMDGVRSGELNFHAIEVMACPEVVSVVPDSPITWVTHQYLRPEQNHSIKRMPTNPCVSLTRTLTSPSSMRNSLVSR